MSKIFLRVSEISSFLGQNKFSIIEPFERLINQINPNLMVSSVNSLKRILDEREVDLQKLYFERDLVVENLETNKLTTESFVVKMKELDHQESIMHKIIRETSGKIDDLTLTIEQVITKTFGKKAVKEMKSAKIDLKKKREDTIKMIKESKSLPQSKKSKMLKDTNSLISTTHGILYENSGIAAFERLHNVKLDTSQRLVQVEYKNLNFVSTVIILGKLDGINLDPVNPSNNYIVEVKNRVSRFFDKVRDYDNTQIQLYCWMSNIKSARLVEKFGNDIKVTQIDYDQEYISNLFAGLDVFIKRIESGFLSNPELISNYFQSDQVEKLKFLKELYLDEINLMFNAVKKESTDKVKGKKSKSGKDVINNGLVLVDGANPDLECKSNTMEPSDVLFIEADDDQTNIPKEVKDEVANESLMEKSATLQRSFSFILPKSPRSVKNKLKDNLEIVAASNTELLIASESVQTVIDLS